MNGAKWANALDLVRNHVVRIETPTGFGTGFLCSRQGDVVGIVTAYHVIQHADYWQEPIKLHTADSSASRLLSVAERIIASFKEIDLAIINTNARDFPLPDKPLLLMSGAKKFREGVEVGWCGFPATYPSTLGFFTGRISAWVDTELSYLVDGVAINGVSGGPAFLPIIMKGNTLVLGVVSAYIPNRATGEALPGVSVIRSVNIVGEIVQKAAKKVQEKEKEGR